MGTDVVYLYDGWRCIEERELDGATWEARRQYVYGSRYIDEVLLFDNDADGDGTCHEPDGRTRYLYCQDANFNVVALTDDAGVLVERMWYEAYGTSTCRRESDGNEQTASHYANPYLFQGRRYDTESGLYYFRHRYMSPTLGRFLQRDPEGYVDGMNLYASMRGAPIAGRDPYGEERIYRPGEIRRLTRWKVNWECIRGAFSNLTDIPCCVDCYNTCRGLYAGPGTGGGVAACFAVYPNCWRCYACTVLSLSELLQCFDSYVVCEKLVRKDLVCWRIWEEPPQKIAGGTRWKCRYRCVYETGRTHEFSRSFPVGEYANMCPGKIVLMRCLDWVPVPCPERGEE